VFVVDSLFTDQFERFGFPESMVNMLELMDEGFELDGNLVPV
ncbi:uncharacterized protein METZ01_LOCUS425136, partial [marine metagenome]